MKRRTRGPGSRTIGDCHRPLPTNRPIVSHRAPASIEAHEGQCGVAGPERVEWSRLSPVTEYPIGSGRRMAWGPAEWKWCDQVTDMEIFRCLEATPPFKEPYIIRLNDCQTDVTWAVRTCCLGAGVFRTSPGRKSRQRTNESGRVVQQNWVSALPFGSIAPATSSW